MVYNNTVILTGNLGSEANIYNQNERPFATVSMATVDSYKDANDNWVQRDSIWHSIIAFRPTVINQLKSLKKGTRVKITGALSYRPFAVTLEDGKTVTKHDVSIIANKLELVPLVKKS